MKLTILCVARGGEEELAFLRALTDIGGLVRAEFIIAPRSEQILQELPLDLIHYVLRAKDDLADCLRYCTGDFVLCIEPGSGSWMARRDPASDTGWKIVPSQPGGPA